MDLKSWIESEQIVPFCERFVLLGDILDSVRTVASKKVMGLLSNLAVVKGPVPGMLTSFG